MDSIIVVSRLSFHFIKNAFKVFLKCDYKTAAKRIFMHEREEEKYDTEEDVYNELVRRANSDERRYKKYYGLKIDDMYSYDMMLDTTSLTAEEIAGIIFEAVSIASKSKAYNGKK